MQTHTSHRNTTQAWIALGEKKIFVRSKWEGQYAAYLEQLKTMRQISDWEHEPRTFWFDGIKRGTVSYKPDFLVRRLDGSHYWVEVKGHMDSKSNTKIKRFHKYFPDETLIVIDSKWFSRYGSIAQLLLAKFRSA